MADAKATCELCGEPMPVGEEVFKFHGYSGPCPKPPLKRTLPIRPEAREIIRNVILAHSQDITADALADAILSALKDAGYAVVPVEPTSQTLIDILDKVWDMRTKQVTTRHEMYSDAADLYRAMLRASQEG